MLSPRSRFCPRGWVQSGRAGAGMRPGDVCAPSPVVVVGIDGSPGAGVALRWALAEAQRWRSGLRLVHAWEIGYSGMSESRPAALDRTLDDVPSAGFNLVRRGADGLLERMLARAGADAAALATECLVVEGSPADVLVDAAREGDLLVLGSRRHSGLGDLTQGYVAQQCADRAPCRVVVVPSGGTCTSAPVAEVGGNVA